MATESKRRQTSIILTDATDRQVAYLQARGYGSFTDIVRVAIHAMWWRDVWSKSRNEKQVETDE